MKKLNYADHLNNLDLRSRDIFRLIVESYLTGGEPVGSRNLSRLLTLNLSPATVRNVMKDLEDLGLIFSPHVSAGRLPTQSGLRLFIDAFMEVDDLSLKERQSIEMKVKKSSHNQSVEDFLSQASHILSAMSHGAGLVVTNKTASLLKHIEFVRLDSENALVILVNHNDEIENRIIKLPQGVTPSQLVEASNFLNSHILGKSLSQAKQEIERLRQQTQAELDSLSQSLVEEGLAVWAGQADDQKPQLIVRGRANLLEDVRIGEDLERIRRLFDDLETRESLVDLLDLTEEGSGVRIFIGSENKLFSLSGSSLIVAPYKNSQNQVIGALGVIGPTRLNYARIVPVVDYTALLISKLLG